MSRRSTAAASWAQFHPVMHPLLLSVAAAIIGLAVTPSTRRHLAVDR